ncbi:MAG: hypothetical protein HOH13_03350 [Crocinitomicaceae bacterium]|nr:hypothetical protein [Crocinitomicaceae bacterium]
MKTIKKSILLMALVVASCHAQICWAQMVELRSSDLDHLIWNKINDRLIALGKEKIKHFKEGPVRDFAYRTCARLVPENATFAHSSNDSISWYSGGECIYSCTKRSSGENEFIDYILSNNLDPIAQLVVDGWVGSESHREAMSKDWYSSTTVATIIQIDEQRGYFKICSAWYELDYLIFGNLGGY